MTANQSNSLHPEKVCGQITPTEASVTSFKQRAHERALTEQLIQQKELLIEKQQQLDELQNEHQLIMQHVKIIETEWENSNNMLEQLMLQLADAKKAPSEELKQQLADFKQQVEEAQTSKSVLKHHCRQLNDRNEELNDLLRQSSTAVDELEIKVNNQSDAINELRNENVSLKQKNIVLNETVKRQEKQLHELQLGYYTDVINKDKRISRNLPR